ncbi:PAS domain-containing protein [Desulfospira joergensenii]|uniref:PAS domain-containing protein n=1 Tax=Desulfospira joergensenii TaxID=53329 RepID=UPI0003B67817|nr:PAS domain-containing protein [Desulfospira joergensenii]
MDKTSLFSESFSLLDSIPIGVCVIDKDHDIVFWNRCLEAWTKKTRKEVAGRSLGDVYPHFNKEDFKGRINTVLAEGAPLEFSSQVHGLLFPSALPNGKSRIFQTTVSRVSIPGEPGFFALFAVEDFTQATGRIMDFRKIQEKAEHEIEHRKSMEAELRAANEKIVQQQKGVIEEERLKVLLQMAGATAHELNQPLMILLGNIELLEMDQNDPEKMAVHISKIEQAGKRMADIVRKIQEVKRVAKKPYSGGDEIIDFDSPSQKP